jgi:thymidine kinase
MQYYPTNSGWIEVVAGSMFSGKTEELIRRLKRAHYAKQKVQVFKPVVDKRYDDNAVISHEGFRIEGVAVDRPLHIMYLLDDDTKIVGIDEAQFFSDEIVVVANYLADKGIRVIVAGLDQDYLGQPFGPMPQLLAAAEYVTKVHAICIVCGNPGTRTYRATGGEDLVELGSSDKYEARCRKCHAEDPQKLLDIEQMKIKV